MPTDENGIKCYKNQINDLVQFYNQGKDGGDICVASKNIDDIDLHIDCINDESIKKILKIFKQNCIFKTETEGKNVDSIRKQYNAMTIHKA